MKSVSMIVAALVSLALAQAQGTGVVEGTVRGPNGEVTAGIRVAAMPVSGNATDVLVSITETDKDGRYRLENIPAGRYYIAVGLVSALTYCPGTRDQRLASTVTVAAEVALTGFNCRVTLTGVTVSGHVISPSPNPRWSVVLEGPLEVQARADADGSFRFLRLPPGKYTASIVGFRPAYTTFVVGDRDIEGVEIAVPTQVSVGGRLVTEDGKPLPAVPLTVTTDWAGAPPSSQSVIVEPTGRFVMSLLTGDRKLSIGGLPAGYSLKSIRYGTIDVGLGSFKLVNPPQGEVVLTIAATPAATR